MGYRRLCGASGRTGSPTSGKSASRFDHRQHDYGDEEEQGHFVEDPEPAFRVRVAPVAQVTEQLAAPEVIDDERGDQHELHAQPEEVEITRGGCNHREAEDDGERAAHGHHAEEPPLHDNEALAPDGIGRCYVIYEEPGQIEEPGEPGDDEDDVEGFEPEHS